jgi:hypothetical protein
MALLLLWLIFIFFPRKEYKIPDPIKEKIILRVSDSLQDDKSKKYILDLNTKQYVIYTGSYTENSIIQNRPTWDTIAYSPNHNYYIKDMQIYGVSGLIKTYPTLTIGKIFKYWTKDNNYLIAIDNTKKNIWLLWFDIWWPSVQIIDLKTWSTEQIYFHDSVNPNLRIIDLIWIAE